MIQNIKSHFLQGGMIVLAAWTAFGGTTGCTAMKSFVDFANENSYPGALAQNQPYHYVHDYYRADGTLVPGHYQTNPDSTIRNNWSTKPNVNPFTGKEGTIDPDDEDDPTDEY